METSTNTPVLSSQSSPYAISEEERLNILATLILEIITDEQGQ